MTSPRCPQWSLGCSTPNACSLGLHPAWTVLPQRPQHHLLQGPGEAAPLGIPATFQAPPLAAPPPPLRLLHRTQHSTQGSRECRGPPSAWGPSRLAWPPRRTGQEACPSHSSPSHTSCLHPRAVSVIHKRASSCDLHLLPGSLFSPPPRPAPRGTRPEVRLQEADPGLQERQQLALLPAACRGLRPPPRPPAPAPHRTGGLTGAHSQVLSWLQESGDLPPLGP